MRSLFRSLTLATVILALSASVVFAQAPTAVTAVPPPPTNPILIPISATASAGSPAVLTIPAAAGLYNYVCYLAYDLSVGAGGTVTTNGTSSSTNFNSFAYKVSSAGTANTQSAVNVLIGGLSPSTGCVKSTLPGTSTTFTSPTTAATAFDWYAVYFQWPQ